MEGKGGGRKVERASAETTLEKETPFVSPYTVGTQDS